MKFAELCQKAMSELSGTEQGAVEVVEIVSALVPKNLMELLEAGLDHSDIFYEPININPGGIDTVKSFLAWRVFEELEEYVWSKTEEELAD